MPKHLNPEDVFDSSASPARALAEYGRFLKSYRQSTGREPDLSSPGFATLSRIFGNSDCLAGRLASHPEWLDEICSGDFPDKPRSREAISAEIERESGGMQGAGLADRLRIIKYREMTRIAARELSGRFEEREILLEWSDLADAILDRAYRAVFEELSSKFGAPEKPDGGICQGAIIALGKLGSGELNMSSDVDLLFIYDTDDSPPATKNSKISSHEFFEKLAAEITKFLSAVTSEGFLFRVDHELRPEGSQGPLANSVDAAERYYQYFGSAWERQALMRARTVAGSMETGRRFIDAVTPFVYRRTLSMNDLSHMREMKTKIEREATSIHGPLNLKLGIGGIRELEFFVQALIQLYGGLHEGVRTPRTFDAIDGLSAHSFLHPDAASQLRRAYSFLRRAENFLQLQDDRQTHSLPKSPAALNEFARKLGFDGAPKLESALQQTTSSIHRLFSSLFEEDYDRCEIETAIRENLEGCGSDEERTDSLAWFRGREQKKLIEQDLAGRIATPVLFKRLSTVADAVLATAFEMALRGIKARFGTPRHAGKPAEFCILGMGSLGSREMDYGSDLDLCFIYSGEGRTDGQPGISNVEFFTRLAQRIIQLVSMMTRYGRAYNVDSELRPSGGQGALVTTLEAFGDYHTNKSATWERLAMLKTRCIAGDRDFLGKTSEAIFEIAYLLQPPQRDLLKSEIRSLRQRQVDERGTDREGRLDLKLGSGSIADIDSIIRFHQLQSAGSCKSLCVQNSFALIEALGSEGIISESDSTTLMECSTGLQKILSKLRLYTGRAAGTIDEKAEYLTELAGMCGMGSAGELVASVREIKGRVAAIYNDTFK